MIMFRPLAALAAFLLLLAMPWSARAELMARDHVPAATVLFPHFEVDLDNPDGANTLLTWTNASATAILTNVTVYSDLGVPAVSFNTYLTGYDVVTFDIRALLTDGVLPGTASAGQDPGDLISNKGPISQDINFASCNGQLPYQPLFASTVTDLRQQLTGKMSSLSGQCSGFDHGDNIARGYVTLSTVNNCTTRSPGDPGYFGAGGSGDVTNQNVVYGEWVLLGDNARMVHSGAGVAIEANRGAPDPQVTDPGEYTFFGRHVGYLAIDNREPLPATWALDTQARDAELIVWRDPKVPPARFSCALDGPAAFYPLNQEAAILFDVQAQVTEPSGPRFPLVSQRVSLAEAGLPTGTKSGWTYLSLNTAVGGSGNPPEDPAAAQSYITVVQFPERAGVGGNSGAAIAIDSAGDNAVHVHPFEFGP